MAMHGSQPNRSKSEDLDILHQTINLGNVCNISPSLANIVIYRLDNISGINRPGGEENREDISAAKQGTVPGALTVHNTEFSKSTE